MKLQLILQSSIFQILPDSFWTKKYFQSLPNNFGLRTRQTLYFPITPKTAGKKAVWKRGTLIKLLFYIQIFHRKPISLENNINLWWWVQVRCPLPSGLRRISLYAGLQPEHWEYWLLPPSPSRLLWHPSPWHDDELLRYKMSPDSVRGIWRERNKRWGQMLKWGIVTNNFTDWSWN